MRPRCSGRDKGRSKQAATGDVVSRRYFLQEQRRCRLLQHDATTLRHARAKWRNAVAVAVPRDWRLRSSFEVASRAKTTTICSGNSTSASARDTRMQCTTSPEWWRRCCATSTRCPASSSTTIFLPLKTIPMCDPSRHSVGCSEMTFGVGRWHRTPATSHTDPCVFSRSGELFTSCQCHWRV